jgi:hypothetical protein
MIVIFTIANLNTKDGNGDMISDIRLLAKIILFELIFIKYSDT